MNRPHEILIGPLCLALLATTFSAWSALGNEVSICVTAGCSLYQDSAIAGIPLWWLGAGIFAALAGLALLGQAAAGRALAGLALLGDVFLLALMAFTAPCVSCLVAAVFFALLYLGFRQATATRNRASRPGRSVLLAVWLVLFIVNVGAVARSLAQVWPLTDNGEEATVHMFFSPSCPSCREGIRVLSGHVDVAFYPVAENEADVYKTARMMELLDQGQSMAQALEGAQQAQPPTGLAAWWPDHFWLRFRLLRNKAHIFLSGGQAVPFFEYHGLPSMLTRQGGNPARNQGQSPPLSSAAPQGQNGFVPTTDPTLPAELAPPPQIAGQCSGPVPCP